jgi:hypothetical protein
MNLFYDWEKESNSAACRESVIPAEAGVFTCASNIQITMLDAGSGPA